MFFTEMEFPFKCDSYQIQHYKVSQTLFRKPIVALCRLLKPKEVAPNANSCSMYVAKTKKSLPLAYEGKNSPVPSVNEPAAKWETTTKSRRSPLYNCLILLEPPFFVWLKIYVFPPSPHPLIPPPHPSCSRMISPQDSFGGRWARARLDAELIKGLSKGWILDIN